jgi:hypothetical protein
VRKRSFFGTPNRFFERQHGARLRNRCMGRGEKRRTKKSKPSNRRSTVVTPRC